MSEPLLAQLASIPILGISAQWLAWRLELPAILLLLLFGLLAGPVTGLLQPEALLGPLLPPVVSLAVAVILFEGGLSLTLAELGHLGPVVRRLLTVGSLFTWAGSTGAAYYLLGFSLPLAALLGAILVVTGPTVIGPLLRHVRPQDRLASILRWEGIVIDPLGAILAVLVFEAVLAGGLSQATAKLATALLTTLAVGGLFGLLGAGLTVVLFKRYWIPDFLHSPMVLVLVIGCFTGANELRQESGLLAVTVMGIILANQGQVAIKHVSEFKENLSVLLVSSLFILLAARLQLSDLSQLDLASLGFLGILILLLRPGAVALATWRSDLDWRARLFLAWMAPRGIVAASVASLFALRLAEAGYPGAERLVPITFLVIIGTVALYGLTAAPLARWLGVAKPSPQGVLLAGAHRFARALALALQEAGYPVLLADTNEEHIAAARRSGLPTYHGSLISQGAPSEMDLSGIGRLLALAVSDEANALAVARCAEFFGRNEVYQLSPDLKGESEPRLAPHHWRGRLLFNPGLTYKVLAAHVAAGAVVKAIKLTESFDYPALLAYYGDGFIPLLVIEQNATLRVITTDTPLAPRPGQTLVCLVYEPEKKVVLRGVA